jgi:tripartite-type tricarboxylate transporter receptor subunit TctC
MRWIRATILPLAVLAPAVLEAQAQDKYPVRPIRLIVPTGPGAGNDLQARLIAQPLGERLGQPVVVENRTGAATIIGSEIVAKAPSDGYTLLMNVSTLAINPATYRKMPYDALRDFAPITQTVAVPNALAINPALPVRSLKELIALARARPNDILYGTGGHGTNPHLTIELLANLAQVRLFHVPYKSGPEALTALLGGEVMLNATSLFESLPHVKRGKLRVLGVTSARRSTAAPDIPTIAESGLPGYESVQWSALLAPAKTPREIIDRLHREVAAILRTPELRERLAREANEVVASSPDELAVFLQAETQKWARVVKAAGIQPQ